MRQRIGGNQTVLGNGGVFTSDWFDTCEEVHLNSCFVSTSIFANQASAANGAIIQETDDQTNIRDINSDSIVASTLLTIRATVVKKFWRVKITNGVTPQTVFSVFAGDFPVPIIAVDKSGNLALSISGTTDVNLKQVNGSTIALGQTTASASLPVILASDQVLPLPTAPTPYIALTQVTKANIKSSAGNVMSILISNENASKRFFQLHNKATAPAAADVPVLSIPIGGGTANNPQLMVLGSDLFTDKGMAFVTGIGWAISTTRATFTDAATNTEHDVTVMYR